MGATLGVVAVAPGMGQVVGRRSCKGAGVSSSSAASQRQVPWLFPCVVLLPPSSLPRTQPRWFLLCLGAGDPEAEPWGSGGRP